MEASQREKELAGMLLLLERDGLASLRSSIRDALAPLAYDEKPTRNEVAARIRALQTADRARPRIAVAVAAGIIGLRKSASKSANGRVALLAKRDTGLSIGALLRDNDLSSHPSLILPSLTGRSYADAWAAQYAAEIERRILTGKSFSSASAIRAAVDATEDRIRRIAVTENASAFDVGIRETTRRAKDVIAGTEALVMWCALLESPTTCSFCIRMHGRTAKAGHSFGGLWPGRVHPHCRCFSVPVFGNSAKSVRSRMRSKGMRLH